MGKPSGGRNRKRTQKRKEAEGQLRDLSKNTGWDLSWYCPEGRQQDIVEAIDDKELVIVNAPSGCGKSSTVIYKALCDYKEGVYRKVMLIKNPTEAGDDKIGFLSGDKKDKLTAHIESMKKLFLQFMPANKLENDMSNFNIVIDVPNYLLGSTIDDTLIIIEEAQTMSPQTLKLCMERAGVGSKVVVVGDSRQRYSVSHRKDGLADLVHRVTYEDRGVRFSKYRDTVGYIEMDSSHNMRSDLSKFITDIYMED